MSGSDIGESGHVTAVPPQPRFGLQAARALLSGPEDNRPEPAGGPLERWVAAWAPSGHLAATKGGVAILHGSMLLRLR
eukprot:scaffold40855_cov63-Phaeocystis_antarctica.AAC.8